ncbi:hypothetical protein VaNZ11_009769, partial [Volvox africanus]
GSGNSGDAAVAATAKPNALTMTTTTALEAETLRSEPLAAIAAVQQAAAGTAPKTTSTLTINGDDSCSGAVNDVSEDLAADVDMADDAAVTAEPEGPCNPCQEYSDEFGGNGPVARPGQATPGPAHHRPLGGGWQVGGSSSRETSYPMDIYGDDSSYELQADVPGMREGDISIEILDRHRLVVEGNAAERVRPLTAAEAGLPPGRKPLALRTERRRRRHFKRTFRLPHDVDHRGVTAFIEDGVLIVR